ncbi:MAG: hypothetical protein ABFS08_12500 [Pseudomonadota bacterium]
MEATSENSNHYRIKIILTAFLLLFGLTSCGGFKAFQKPFEEEGSLVFGYIDTKDAPSDFRWITMKQINPDTPTGKYGFFVEKDLFYRTYVPNGLFKFHEFGGYSYRMGGIDLTYAFPLQGKQEIDPVIKKQGIHYVGSYKYVKEKAPLLELRYSLKRINKPSEIELLRRILQKKTHPSWKNRIEQRIKEINQ